MPPQNPPSIDEVRAAIAERDGELNSVVHLFTTPLAPTGDGPLRGEVVMVKDNIAVTGAPWSAGSATRLGSPASFDAECVRRVRDAGAVIVAMTNLDEFAMGASTASSCFGPTHNPWDLTRTAGGSSGGSAAASAAYGVTSLGTDTGGSIREPAAQCGVVGVKPSGRQIPLHGVVPFALTYDAVGPIAPTVWRAARLDDAMRCTDEMTLAVQRGNGATLDGMVLGVITQMADHRNSPEVRDRFARALDACERLGAQLVEVDVPNIVDSLQTYLTTTSIEAIAVLQEHAARGTLGEEAARRLEHARSVNPQEVARAVRHRHELKAELLRVAAGHDLLVSPAMPIVAPPLSRPGLDDPLAAPRTDWWTVEANIAGLGAMSLPNGLGSDSGLPIGLQLMCAPGNDASMYFAAACLEPHVA